MAEVARQLAEALAQAAVEANPFDGLPLVDQVAVRLRLHQWAYRQGDPASWLAEAIVRALRVYFCESHEVLHGPPVQVGPVLVTVTTADARRRRAVRETLEQRARRDDVEGQVLVATAGAGVGHPGMIGGKPCALVYLTAAPRGA